MEAKRVQRIGMTLPVRPVRYAEHQKMIRIRGALRLMVAVTGEFQMVSGARMSQNNAVKPS
jgi:hypothetical protein